MIDIKRLSVKYRNNSENLLAIDQLNLSIGPGDICAIIGPSGSGKSTLLYVLSGLIKEYSGSVLINGLPPDPKKQRIGLIPQNYGLLPWKNVYDNAILGLKIKDSDISERSAYAEYVLGKLGLDRMKDRYPIRLSGGERQRTAIARSFILKPDILLMDEPFSALDAITREEAQDLFLDVWMENKVTTVFVTHSIDEAVYLGKKIAILSPSPGRIIRVLENPIFGMGNLRLLDDYYKLGLEIRKMAKEEWSKCNQVQAITTSIKD